jgi:hypothetical protein
LLLPGVLVSCFCLDTARALGCTDQQLQALMNCYLVQHHAVLLPEAQDPPQAVLSTPS